MISFGLSDKGIREENQDSILLRGRDGSGLFIVADGIGGLSRGAEVSSYITERYALWWEDFLRYRGQEDFSSLFGGIKAEAEKLNAHVCGKYGAGKSGSTLALVFIHRGIYGYLSSGDSRVYMRGRDGVRQLNRDDTWGNRPGGRPGDAGAKKIMSAVGGYEALEYSCATAKLERRACFMLCTDGLYRFVPEEAICRTLARTRLALVPRRSLIERLAEEAARNASDDNYSLIVVRV